MLEEHIQNSVIPIQITIHFLSLIINSFNNFYFIFKWRISEKKSDGTYVNAQIGGFYNQWTLVTSTNTYE